MISTKDLSVISSQLWQDIPENISKILQYLSSSISTHEKSLKTLESSVKTLKSPPDKLEKEEDHLIDLITTKVKESELQSSRKLAVLINKINTKIESIESEISSLQDSFSKVPSIDQSDLNKKFDLLRYELKKEISTELISPFDFELKENYKSQHLIEQQLKVQTWNIEASLKEINCRFEVHREKICKIENIASEFAKEVHGIIMKEIVPIKAEILESEDKAKDLYSKFKVRCKRTLEDFGQKTGIIEDKFSDAVRNIEKIKGEIEKSIKNIVATNNLHIQRMEASLSQAQLQMENLKCEITISQRECYDDAKNDLMNSYKKDISIIYDKLRWLPSNLQDISDMTPIEARLFTIETRIKTEETNRINDINEVMKSKNYAVISTGKIKKEKIEVKEENKPKCITSRCITPLPINTKICKSPGGMRLLSSISNTRIKKSDILDSPISLNRARKGLPTIL